MKPKPPSSSLPGKRIGLTRSASLITLCHGMSPQPPAYASLIDSLLLELGIPASYALDRQLPIQPEA